MSYLIWIALPALTAALLSAALTPLVARLAVAIGAVDMAAIAPPTAIAVP